MRRSDTCLGVYTRMRTNGEREKARTRENEAIKHYITIMGTDSTGNRVRDKDRDRDRDRDRATNRTATQQATPHTNTVMCAHRLSFFAVPASAPSPSASPSCHMSACCAYVVAVVHCLDCHPGARREREGREKACMHACMQTITLATSYIYVYQVIIYNLLYLQTRTCLQPATKLQTKSVTRPRTHLGLPARRDPPALIPSRPPESLQYSPMCPLSELLLFSEEEEGEFGEEEL